MEARRGVRHGSRSQKTRKDTYCGPIVTSSKSRLSYIGVNKSPGETDFVFGQTCT